MELSERQLTLVWPLCASGGPHFSEQKSAIFSPRKLLEAWGWHSLPGNDTRSSSCSKNAPPRECEASEVKTGIPPGVEEEISTALWSICAVLAAKNRLLRVLLREIILPGDAFAQMRLPRAQVQHTLVGEEHQNRLVPRLLLGVGQCRDAEPSQVRIKRDQKSLPPSKRRAMDCQSFPVSCASARREQRASGSTAAKNSEMGAL